MYLSEVAHKSPMRAAFIAASFPGSIIRRHTGTPFMGYSGATYLVQEVCNALFDALFHILPLGTQLDQVEATQARSSHQLTWDNEAQALMQQLVAQQPVLVQISAAKQLRDQAERLSRQQGSNAVESGHVEAAGRELGWVVSTC